MGGTIQIQSCSYGGVGHPHTITGSQPAATTQKLSITTFLCFAFAYQHYIQNRLIVNTLTSST